MKGAFGRSDGIASVNEAERAMPVAGRCDERVSLRVLQCLA